MHVLQSYRVAPASTTVALTVLHANTFAKLLLAISASWQAKLHA